MPGRIESYKDMIVWKQAMDLAVDVYAETKHWPKEELYGLTSRARRAATSVPADVAEGPGRESRNSYQQFLRIAQGSLKELETHLMIAQRVGIADGVSTAALSSQAESVGRPRRLPNRKLTGDHS